MNTKNIIKKIVGDDFKESLKRYWLAETAAVIVLIAAVYTCVFKETAFMTDNNIDMIIITSSTLEKDFKKLADFIEKNGVSVKIISCGEENSERRSAEVKNTILSYVKNNNTKYFLLGGNKDVIPNQYKKFAVSGSKEYLVSSDTYYCSTEDEYGINRFLDISLARAQVSSSEDINALYDKIINTKKDAAMNFCNDIVFSSLN